MFRKSSFCLTLILAFGTVWSFQVSSAPAQSRVVVKRQSDGGFQLLRNGEPYRIKGVGGDTHLTDLVVVGANSIRTWGADHLGRTLQEAQENGLTVCAGLWLGHQRHGFDYQNQAAVEKQLNDSLAVVRKYKNHPALLIWGVGNEMEGEGNDPDVWRAVNDLARAIKQVDPHHPTMTVIAELGENADKVRNIERYCPDIDIIGLNSYGGIESIGTRYRKAGGTKPYIVTEHGTLGPWEVGKTAWGSPVELTSTEKADWYAKGYRAAVVEQPDWCLGSYAFLWGDKQETTATWFGMLLPDGSRLEAVDVMSEAWTGNPLSNRCPKIESLKLASSPTLEPGENLDAILVATDPDGDDLKIEWILRSDSGTIGAGGDRQENETEFANAIKSLGRQATLTAPKGGGGYRLFAYVYDGQGGAAVANVPFFVNAPVELKRAMPAVKVPYVVYADGAPDSVFVPAGYMGNSAAVKMQFDSSNQPYQGDTCLKVSYESPASWGGVLWQSPAGDWDGTRPGGANLEKATELQFWARGERGGEVVNFLFGALNGNQPYRDTAKGELKSVKLTQQWKKFAIPLEGLDMRQIKTGFGWSAAGQGQPVVFYLDDIQYVAR